MNELLEELIVENKRIKKHNKILASQVSVALEGFEVLTSMGDIAANVAKQTVQEMEKYEKDLPQESNKEQDEDI